MLNERVPLVMGIKKAYLFLWMQLMASGALFAQANLVPNPSFEIYTSCPTGGGEVFQAVPWYDPTGGTSDYFNQCSGVTVGVPSNALGNEPARTGVAYCGFYSWRILSSNYREYIQVQLNDTLEWGKKYLVSFYVSHAENTTYGTNRIGAYFSQTAVNNMGPGMVLSYIPQIESDSANPIISNIGWRLIEDTLFANGSELYMTIGNFNDDGNTDTVYIGGSGIDAAYYYVDDVSVIDIGWVGINENGRSDNSIKIFPNPASDHITLDFLENLPSNGNIGIEFYNVLGEKVGTKKIGNLKTQSISVAELDEGMYFYRIIANDKVYYSNRILISR